MYEIRKQDEPKVVANLYGLQVKVWCASCRHKKVTSALISRKCLLNGCKTRPNNVCDGWEMNGISNLKY